MAEGAAAPTWETLKRDGNGFFGSSNFHDAVTAYTAALSLDMPAADRSTILNNRAMSHLKLKQYAPAVEDCTTAMMHTTDSATILKSLYRRACAYEALAQYKDAQQDYAAALERDPASRDTLAGLNRCELQLGLAPTSAAAAKGRAAAGGRGGGAAPRSRVSDEEAKQLLELQNRIKDIKRQQYRAAEQRKGAELEKRRCDLTNSMLDQLPKDRRVYASVGRMYCLSSVDGERARVEEAKARSLDKLRLCGVTAEHLAQREKEEDAAFMEALEVIKRRK